MFDPALFLEHKLSERYSVPGAVPCINGLSIEWRYMPCAHFCPKVRYKSRKTRPKCDVHIEHHFKLFEISLYFLQRKRIKNK